MKISVRNNYTLEIVKEKIIAAISLADLVAYLKRVESLLEHLGYKTTWLGDWHLIVFKGAEAYSITRF